MFRARSEFLPYTVASPADLKRHLGATGALKRTLDDDAYLAFDWLSREVARAAEDAGTIPCYAPRYDELAAWAESLGHRDGLPEAIRGRVSQWRTEHDESVQQRAEIEAYPDRVELLRMTRDGTSEAWRREGFALARAGRAMLTGEPAWRPHLDAMPGARNELGESLRTVHGLLELSGVLEPADATFILPCHGRVLAGDRIRSTVHGPPRSGYESRGEKLTIEGEVTAVVAMGRSGDDLVTVQITASSGEGGPRVGSSEWLPMRTLLEYRCARMVWEDEEERARLEEIDRRELAERERMLDAARSRNRQRQFGRNEDRGISW